MIQITIIQFQIRKVVNYKFNRKNESIIMKL